MRTASAIGVQLTRLAFQRPDLIPLAGGLARIADVVELDAAVIVPVVTTRKEPLAPAAVSFLGLSAF
jgi:hypothetical protein